MSEALERALRRPALDEDEERGLEELVMGRWLDRASWALERLEVEALVPRLASELLITWQALERSAADAPHGEERAALLDALRGVADRQGARLVALGAEALALEGWSSALARHVAEVGAPTSWDRAQAERARRLVEELDGALLFEAASEALEVALGEALGEQLQLCAAQGAQAAHSLMPAQIFIRATAHTLDTSMSHASGTYGLWLALMEAREAWALGELAARWAASLYQRPQSSGAAPILDLATLRARKHSALLGQLPTSSERAERPAPHAPAASLGAEVLEHDGQRLMWRAASGWSAWTRYPSRQDGDEREVALFVKGLPCAGAVCLLGLDRAITPEQLAVSFTAGELRSADDSGFALVFVGVDGRVEVAERVGLRGPANLAT